MTEIDALKRLNDDVPPATPLALARARQRALTPQPAERRSTGRRRMVLAGALAGTLAVGAALLGRRHAAVAATAFQPEGVAPGTEGHRARGVGHELVPSVDRVTAVAVLKRDDRAPVDGDAEHLVLAFLAVRVGDRDSESDLRPDVERPHPVLAWREMDCQPTRRARTASDLTLALSRLRFE